MAADVLARTGPDAQEAVSGLLEKVGDDHWWVRRNALEALRAIGADSGDVLQAVFRSVKDPDYRVRRNAALLLCNLGEAGDPAVGDLVDVLLDENRYNRFYAGLALRRIGTPRAREALLDALFTARWCATTTADDLY
jgi:HEAT repeat protein